ncbi:MAG TPA: M23 family metallopeptidase [Actinomycetota bacterium]
MDSETKNIPRTRRKVIQVRRVKVLNSDGPFRLCPVQARGYYSNDFGPRSSGEFHEGNDMFADLGSPVVAPFDGRAVAAPGKLAGLAVKVFGAQGYVYNAHLSAYGRLGRVRAGTVIGYVGNTGNILGGPPRDHFEWHPKNGSAADPYPLLKQVCR